VLDVHGVAAVLAFYAIACGGEGSKAGTIDSGRSNTSTEASSSAYSCESFAPCTTGQVCSHEGCPAYQIVCQDGLFSEMVPLCPMGSQVVLDDFCGFTCEIDDASPDGSLDANVGREAETGIEVGDGGYLDDSNAEATMIDAPNFE
jgi:hypothetical protein